LASRADAIDEYVVWRRRTSTPGNVRKELTIIKAVFNAAYERNLIAEKPLRVWPRLRLPEHGYPEPLPEDAFRRALEALEGTKAENVVRYLAWTGSRPVDACRLLRSDLQDLDGPEPLAVVRQAKTGRLVAIALSPPAVEAIRAELARGIDSPYVFARRGGQPWTPSSVCWAIHMLGERCGFPLTAKTFRQSIVSRLYDAGADGELVRRITGHQSQAIGAYRRLRRGAAHDLARLYAEEMTGDR